MPRIIELTPPTQEAEENDVAASLGRIIELTPPTVGVEQPAQTQEEDGGILGSLERIGSEALGALETGAAFASGILAEPLAGIGGLAKTITTGPEAGEDVIRQVREGLTFIPRGEEAKRNLEAVGSFLAPVGKGLQKVESFLGDLSKDTFAETGSPTLQGFAGAFGASLPTAALEILGFKGAGKLAKRKGLKQATKRTAQQERAIQAAAPNAEKLKEVARGVYKEIDDIGATVRPASYDNLVNNVQAGLKKGGFRPRIDKGVADLLDEFNQNRGGLMSVADVDDLRVVAQGFAKSIDPKTKALGNIIIDRVDDFLDSEGVLSFPKGTPANIGQNYRQARRFYGQSKRSEKIAELQELAEGNRASFLNGVQTEFKQLIRSHIKKKAPGKYFSRQEIKLMQEVVSGKKTTNFFKNLAKLQITRAGGGSLTPLIFGPGGGVITGIASGDFLTGAGVSAIFPIIGEVSNALAVKLTKNNLRLADDIIRAGGDGRKIAQAYFENVPKKLRSADELAELLVDPDLDVSKLPKTKFTQQALDRADEIRKQRLIIAEQAALAAEGEREPQVGAITP